LSLDPYTPEDQIAVGPSGKIYRGRCIANGRHVRIKALLGSQHVGCPVDRGVLQITLPYVLNLEHPQVARLLDIDQDDDDFAIVHEFSPGLTGWEFVRQRQLMLPDARAVAAQLVMALQAGEELGLHHGDVKPSNVIIADHPGGGVELQLQDWGLAACRYDQPDETLRFRAPERLAGGDATIQSDLFSVGATLIALLTGRDPVEHAATEQLDAAWASFDLKSFRHRRADLDPAFHDWLVWLLRYDPTMRPASAQQALDLLQSTGIGYTVPVYPAMMPAYPTPMWPAPQSMTPVPMAQPATQAPGPKPVVRPPVTRKEAPAAPAPAKRPRGMFAFVFNLTALAAVIGFFVWMTSHWGSNWPQELRKLVVQKLGGTVEAEPLASSSTSTAAVLAPSEGVMGQFVRVEIPGTATLNLAEIEVISGGTNIAPLYKAEAKDSAWGTSAARINDGNTSGNWNDNGIYHSKDNTDTPWVQIDLGSERPIQSIKVWNRTDRSDYSRRLSNYSVLVFSRHQSVVWRVDEQPTPADTSVTFDLARR